MAGSVQLVTVGTVPKSLLKELAQPIAQAFRASSVSGAPLNHPEYAFNPARGQYHSAAILRRLAVQVDAEHIGVLGICDVDVFIPDGDFVFGESDRQSKTGLVSIFRLRQGAQLEALVHRAQAEAIHEVGHLVGLSDCDDLHCAMFLSRSVADTDRKGTLLCNDCRHELARLMKS